MRVITIPPSHQIAHLAIVSKVVLTKVDGTPIHLGDRRPIFSSAPG
jgi:hypothetical protein